MDVFVELLTVVSSGAKLFTGNGIFWGSHEHYELL
jgi:hypothetical protein